MKLGLDIGNSTLKMVLLDNDNNILLSDNLYHYGNIDKYIEILLNRCIDIYGNKKIKLGITGDNSQIYKKLEKFKINEIPCSIEGVKQLYPQAKTIIDIGAQNSKFITNFDKQRNKIIFSTNTNCAAGTGSFLEEQASRLKIDLEDISKLCRKSTKKINIAGRCSVFSKTDITHHHQEGVKLEDILMGLCTALVRNFKGNVIKKYSIEKPIVIIGGLNSNYGIIKAFKEILKVDGKELIYNEYGGIVTAFGAGILSQTKDLISFDSIKKILKTDVVADSNRILKPLLEFGVNDSINKHIINKNCIATNCRDIKEVYLGIDIGSTSTNLVILDENENVLSYKYLRTKGKPIEAVQTGLLELEREFDGQIVYKSIVTTGSGRYLIGKMLNADEIINEITTQAKAVIHLDKEVDTIFEIGGQDSKFISIENGVVNDFEMNKICAAGTGSFLEEQSIKLGTPIEEFSKIALKGNNPFDLGERCTVFMEGSIHKAIGKNISKEDIYSGLCYSIVKNYLNGVVGNRKLGEKIFLQGGIAYNQGVINAFRAVTGKKIIVPPFFSVTGAYGASLYAKEIFNQKAKSKNKKSMVDVNYKKEKKNVFLENYTEIREPNKKTVGIPRVLFFHKLFPIFNKFFRSLGFNVILTDLTSKETINKSREYSTIETCYPIKLVNGHIIELIEKNVDYIFLPNLHEVKHHNSKTRKDYSCTYMQSVGEIISTNIDLSKKNIKLLSPALTFKFGKTYIAKTLLELCKELEISKIRGINAIKNALLMYTKITNHLEHIGKTVINEADKDEKIFVIMAREYDVLDPVLNMGISKKLEEMGYKVISVGNLEAFSINLEKEYPNMYWPFGQHILAGAKIVRNTPNLYAIHITNHGCGPDGILSHYFKQEMKGKPYLHIEVDEHSSAVGIITRLEAFIDSIDSYKGEKQKWKYRKNENVDCKKIYIPYSYPLAMILKKQMENEGKEVVILPKSSNNSINTGKSMIKGKEYITLTNLLGDIFTNISKEQEGYIFIPQNEGGEVDGQYAEFISRKLYELGYKTKVFSPFIEDMCDDKIIKNYFKIIVLNDLLLLLNSDDREMLLNVILSRIDENKLKDIDIIDIAKQVKITLDKKNNQQKKLLVVGETDIVLNDYLNKNIFKRLEKNYRLYFAPISEMLIFNWDSYIKSKKTHVKNEYIKNLNKNKELIKKIDMILSEYSPFSENVNRIEELSNKYLKHFNSGNGKYRLGKILDFNTRMDGIITVNSMYENTNIVLRHILENKLKNSLKSYLNLEFDYSENENINFLLDNFIYYL